MNVRWIQEPHLSGGCTQATRVLSAQIPTDRHRYSAGSGARTWRAGWEIWGAGGALEPENAVRASFRRVCGRRWTQDNNNLSKTLRSLLT